MVRCTPRYVGQLTASFLIPPGIGVGDGRSGSFAIGHAPRKIQSPTIIVESRRCRRYLGVLEVLAVAPVAVPGSSNVLEGEVGVEGKTSKKRETHVVGVTIAPRNVKDLVPVRAFGESVVVCAIHWRGYGGGESDGCENGQEGDEVGFERRHCVMKSLCRKITALCISPARVLDFVPKRWESSRQSARLL